MAWVRIHDGALTHPKLGPFVDYRNPFCLWVWGLSYAQMHLTDGVILKTSLPTRAARLPAAKLVAMGLWHDEGDSFRVHDYTDWNYTKERIQQERLKGRTRVAEWRAKQDTTA